MNENDYVLRVQNISKAFPGVKALDDVSFDIRRGSFHALVGENGAGKSTLIKILSGFISPIPALSPSMGNRWRSKPAGGAAAWHQCCASGAKAR